ncbi:hypothetical protein [Nonomuraea sp. NPDC050540]|uniref:hypothetical protein n=1 Tax=Nonomuraea sp. NPDC050540 TaxID=3364367 RepID=UPI0037B8D21A
MDEFSAPAEPCDLAIEAATMCARCRTTGLDPAAYHPLIGAALALGATPAAGADGPYRSDTDLIDDLVDLISGVHEHRAALQALTTQVLCARALAGRSNNAAEAADCEAAAEILADTSKRLNAALSRLAAVPAQLGETYEAAYTLVAAGRHLPHDGRWITGQDMPP